MPFLLAGLVTAAICGCDASGGDVVPLYTPEDAPGEMFTLTLGQQVSLSWPAESDNTYWLVNRNRITGAEKVIDSTARDGRYAWTVPEDLDTTHAYDLLAYDGATSELTAQSAPFRVTTGDDLDTNGVVGACTGAGECDDGLFCNGVESCAGSTCTNGLPPCETGAFCDEQRDRCWTPCLGDVQCEPDEFCSNGACVERNVVSNGLIGYVFDAATGDAVDFIDSILVGQDLRVLGPGSVAASDATTARMLAGACSCAWRVEPVSAGIFDATDACSNGFAATEVGDLTLIVDVDCGSGPTRYTQAAYAADPPPPLSCTDETDCPDGMVCTTGICVDAPPAPAVQLLEAITEAPYVVRFALRLLDAEGKVIASGVNADDFAIRENGAAVDLSETNQFVTAAPALPLRVVLVLDYTRSMQNAHAVAPMTQAATEFVSADHFTGTHEFAVIEFHDRTAAGSGFNTVVPLTAADAAGKTAIIAGVPGVNALEAGLSRVWDALESAITLLQAVERKDGEVQAVVFLTDGRDTSSAADPDTLGQLAADNGIRLYPIGFGDVTAGESRLRAMAETSGGAYYTAADTTALLSVFAEVADTLRGQ